MDSLARGFTTRLAVAACAGFALVWLVAALAPARGRHAAPQPAPHAAAAPTHSAPSYGRVPIAFEPNAGRTDRRVRYLAHGRGYALFLTGRSAVLAVRGQTLRMSFAGARAHARLRPRDRLAGRVNYYVGNDPRRWRTGIPTFGRITQRGIYPGIDLTWHGPHALEYDLELAPGANARAIRMSFSGSARPRVERSGALALTTGTGALRMLRPRAWQEVGGHRRPVDVRFVPHGRTVGVRLGRHMARARTVIDPELAYSTFLGGDGDQDEADQVAVDSSGSAYVAGLTSSTDFPVSRAQPDPYASDIYVVKLSPDGSSLMYGTYFGGSSNYEFPAAMALDSAGHVHLTGVTGSRDFPTTAGVVQPQNNCQPDPNNTCANAFVLDLDESGGFVYSTYLGGTGVLIHDPGPPPFDYVPGDGGNGIAVDSDGNTYVVGFANSTDFPTTPGALSETHSADNSVTDGFVTKLSADGTSLVYSTYLGGDGYDGLRGVAVGPDGQAYILGGSQSTNLPVTAGAAQPTSAGGDSDFMVGSLSPAGDALGFLTYLGSTGYDDGIAIALIQPPYEGAIPFLWLVGNSDSPTFPQGGFGHPNAGGNDAVFAQMGTDGTPYGSSFFGGSNGDYVTGAAFDSTGALYLAGVTYSPNFPVVNEIQGTINTGTGEAWAAKIVDFSGIGVYSTYIGGPDADQALGIAVDQYGRAYVVGSTLSADFPVTQGALSDTLGSSADGFIVKLQSRPVVIRSGPPSVTSSSRADFSFKSGDYNMHFYCSIDGTPFFNTGPTNQDQQGEFGSCRSTAHVLNLPDGHHVFRIREFDGAYTLDPRTVEYGWTVDTRAPAPFDLIAPADGSTAETRPTFSWHAADDASPLTYKVLIDGAVDQEVAGADACHDGVCSARATHTLITGPHTWQIRAADPVGNTRDSAGATFTAFDPPVARLVIAPNPALVGKAITFDASGSADATHTITKYEWDLDGDGTYELDTGTTPSTTRSYDTPGTVHVGLRVTDLSTLNASTTAEVRITRGNVRVIYGITINHGDQYTNSPAVRVEPIFPPSTTKMLLSNDGGFLNPDEFAPSETVRWRLASSGPERLPKIVYAHFLLGGLISETYSDDIILDERPPVVEDAALREAAAPGAARTAQLRRWHVRVIAHDSNSGVARIQLAGDRRHPARARRYKRVIPFTSSNPPRFARARDRAGNYSRWRRIR